MAETKNKILYYRDYKEIFIEKCMSCEYFEMCEQHPILENYDNLKNCDLYKYNKRMYNYYILDNKSALPNC